VAELRGFPEARVGVSRRFAAVCQIRVSNWLTRAVCTVSNRRCDYVGTHRIRPKRRFPGFQSRKIPEFVSRHCARLFESRTSAHSPPFVGMCSRTFPSFRLFTRVSIPFDAPTPQLWRMRSHRGQRALSTEYRFSPIGIPERPTHDVEHSSRTDWRTAASDPPVPGFSEAGHFELRGVGLARRSPRRRRNRHV